MLRRFLTVARYRVVSWKGIPSVVEARDAGRSAQVALSQRFQDLIDAVAMREGLTESEAYLDGWMQGEETERPGDAESVAREVAAELEEDFQRLIASRLLGPPR